MRWDMKAQTRSEGSTESTAETSHPPEPLRGRRKSYEAEVLGRLWDRLHKRNEHSMVAIVGEEGSGKSYTALKMASAIDPTFTADRVIYDVVELLKILSNEEHEPGNAYVLDEAGVALGNRTWHDRSQILANQALQLIRSHNLALFFTLPRLGELDSQTEGRLQAFFEIIEKKPDEYISGKWKYLDPDRTDSTGEIYTKYPRVYRNGQRIRVERLKFAPPPDSIVGPYEEDKAAYQEEVYEQTIAEFEDDDDGEDGEKTIREVAAEVSNDGIEEVVSAHGNTGKPYINHQLIRAEYNLTHDDAKAVKSLLDKELEISSDMV